MKRYTMQQLGEGLGLPPRIFVTRDKGEQAFDQLVAQLDSVAEEESLVLIFPPNQVMDVSFADETVIRLGLEIVDGRHGRRRLLLEGLTQDSIDNINAAIRLQRLKLAFLMINPSGDGEILGHLEDSLREVLKMLLQRPSLTAPDLADELELSLNSANNRLKRLFDQHLIRREYEITDKGLTYIYYFWKWEDEKQDE